MKLKIRNYLLIISLFVLSVVLLWNSPNLISLAQFNLSYYIHGLQVPENKTSSVAGVSESISYRIHDQGINPPTTTAQSALVMDLDSGQLLYQKNIHARLLPASTTKLMTALVAVDYYKSGDYLTVPTEALVGGSTMGLETGEKLSFRSLLYGMLLNSGNDAAYALALDYPGGYANFMTQMNNKAESLGLKDTHFDNPAGFDSPGQYSSAYDLSQLAQQIVNNTELSEVVSTKETAVASANGYPEHVLRNVDTLLQSKGFIGIKTGYTDNAGQNFVGLVKRQNHELVTVVLDSHDRFGETANLADWAYQNFTWQEVLN